MSKVFGISLVQYLLRYQKKEISFADIDNKYAITLRLEKTKNNQSQNIKFAKEYSL